MPFTIKIKPKGSSNKPKTLLKKSGKSPEQEGKPQESALIIDRLTVTVTIADAEESYGYIANHMAVDSEQAFKQAQPSKGYNRAYRMMLPSLVDSTKWPFYEFCLVKDGVTRIRLDFIPEDLGSQGMGELHDELWKLLPAGWGYLFANGRVTRIDAAIDLPSVQMSEIFILPKQGMTTKEYCSNGKLQSFQLGKPKGSHTLVYDRKAKRKAQGKSSIGKNGIRVERRLYSPNIYLRDVAKMPCPFGKLIGLSRRLEMPEHEKKSYIWDLFFAAAESRGLPAALALLPQNKRTKYRKHFETTEDCLWDLDSVWERWPEVCSMLKPSNIPGWEYG